VTLKVVSKAAYDMYSGESQPMTAKGSSRSKNSFEAFGAISKCFAKKQVEALKLYQETESRFLITNISAKSKSKFQRLQQL
jgi:hypothetical protein